MSRKPNILFALADDASHFGCFGHDFVKTPCIDRIAEEGVKFVNAFTPNPKCAPSRASILTGKYPWQLEEGCNHYGLFPDNVQTYTDILEDNDYHIGFTGKGWAPGDFTRYGRKNNPAGKAYNNRRLAPPANSKISNNDYASNFSDFLNEKPVDSPFIFWFGCFEPHRPYNHNEGHQNGKCFSELGQIPTYWPDTVEVRTDILDYAFEIEWFDKQLQEMLDLLKACGEYDNTLILVTSDNGCPFPRVKGQMYEQDFHLPMVAVWENALDEKNKGKEVFDFINFIDIAPTFLEAADIKVPKDITGKSFLYTFYSNDEKYIDNSRKTTYFGRERHDIGRENDQGYPVRCIRTDEYLLIHNYCPERWPAGNPETNFTDCDSSPVKKEILERNQNGDTFYFNLSFGKRPQYELYNIKEDSECLKNLAYIKDYKDIVDSLKVRLDKLLFDTNDPRIKGLHNYFEDCEYVGNESHSWSALIEGRWRKQKY